MAEGQVGQVIRMWFETKVRYTGEGWRPDWSEKSLKLVPISMDEDFRSEDVFSSDKLPEVEAALIAEVTAFAEGLKDVRFDTNLCQKILTGYVRMNPKSHGEPLGPVDVPQIDTDCESRKIVDATHFDQAALARLNHGAEQVFAASKSVESVPKASHAASAPATVPVTTPAAKTEPVKTETAAPLRRSPPDLNWRLPKY